MLTPTPSIIITWASAGFFTPRGRGNSPTVRARVFPAFNPITEFFEELHMNYQGVKIEKLCRLQEFQRQPHESL
jgi:hypothetical protein